MFVLTTVADTVRISPHLFSRPTLSVIHDEIDRKYPNRVIMDVGLVVSRHGDALSVGDGVLAAGDGGAHHEVVFRLVVFRPFMGEVCLGTVAESDGGGVRISMGRFFEDVRVPAYWMLRPSEFDDRSGLWVWTPNFDDDEGGGEEGEGGEGGGENENRFEMDIGTEVRFRVKAINFTRITNTAKGVQATTTTTSRQVAKGGAPGEGSSSGGGGAGGGNEQQQAARDRSASDADALPDRPVRKRSTSIDLTEADALPASMHITASICEDGLGLTSWWMTPGEEEEEEGEEGAEGEGEEYYDEGEHGDEGYDEAY